MRSYLLVAGLIWCVCVGGEGGKKKDDKTSSLYSDTIQYTTDTIYSTMDWLAGTNTCPFRPDTFASIEANLHKHIKGQDDGIEAVLNAISGWEFQRQSGNPEPLVLALSGPTGVGKSETAFRIAEGALLKKSRVGNSAKYLPSGLLQLRGEDYSQGDLEQIQERIKTKIADHLERCGGNAVIVFDELQKVVPGALEVLMPALERRGSITRTMEVPVESAFLFPTGTPTSAKSAVTSLLAYTAAATSGAVQYMGKNLVPSGKSSASSTRDAAQDAPSARTKTVTTQHSTENVIFIFVSEIGADKITKLVLSYGNRSAIPQTLLRSEIKTALDEQWGGQRFGKFVNEVVPYLPLEPEHIRAILRAKLRNLAEVERHRWWAELVVDDDVVLHFSSPSQVKYSVYSTKNGAGAASKASAPTSGTENACAAAGLDGTGSSADCTTSTSQSAQAGDGQGGSSSTAPGGVTKIFATWGARSLENAGPLQDLRSLLHRYARPYRPDEILHVGLHSEENRALRNAKWGTQEKAGTITPKSPKQLYLQWCKANEHRRRCLPRSSVQHPAGDGVHSMPVCGEGEVQYLIDDEVAFSSECETVKFGLTTA